MATTGVMADFARLPPQRKAGLFALIAAIVGVLYFQFVFKPLKQSVEDADNNTASMTAQNRKLETDIPKFAALRSKMAELKKIIEDNQKALPTEAELPEFFETLNRKVIEAGVDVRRWDYRSEIPVETFVKAPVDIEITGTFMQIKRFFASLVQKDVGPPTGVAAAEPTEDRERIVSIDNLKLSNPTVVNHEIVLTAKFTASTFRQEAPAPAAGAGSGAGSAAPAGAPAAPAAAGSGAGSGSAAAPSAGSGSAASTGAGSAAKLPSGPIPTNMTPAGVKANVEQSLQKGDARNRNAGGVDDAKTGNPDRLKGGL